jgi:hypothetical protein
VYRFPRYWTIERGKMIKVSLQSAVPTISCFVSGVMVDEFSLAVSDSTIQLSRNKSHVDKGPHARCCEEVRRHTQKRATSVRAGIHLPRLCSCAPSSLTSNRLVLRNSLEWSSAALRRSSVWHYSSRHLPVQEDAGTLSGGLLSSRTPVLKVPNKGRHLIVREVSNLLTRYLRWIVLGPSLVQRHIAPGHDQHVIGLNDK